MQRLTRLLQRVAKATRAFGSRAALARELGIEKQHLNSWLTGRFMPSGEQALRLLEWVTEEEVKQKQETPAGAINTRRGKQTRRKESRDENLKSGPRRKM